MSALACSRSLLRERAREIRPRSAPHPPSSRTAYSWAEFTELSCQNLTDPGGTYWRAHRGQDGPVVLLQWGGWLQHVMGLSAPC